MTTPTIPAAVIYCPALNEVEPGKVIDGVAQRLARTLDHHSDPVETVYTVRTAAPEDYGTDGRSEVREILRIDPGKNPETEGVVTHRVYGLDYLPLLDDPTADANVLVKTWKLLCLCFTMSWRFVAACALAESFSKKQKLSVFVGGIALLGVLLYAGLAVGTVVRLAVDAWKNTPAPVVATEVTDGAPNPPAVVVAEKPAEGWFDRAWAWLRALPGELWAGLKEKAGEFWRILGSREAKLIAVLGALGLSTTGLRAWLDRNVTQSLRFCRYLEQGPARASCTGRFNALLEHVLSEPRSRTDVVAYSLGSLVALDALYPSEGNPNVRVAGVNSLTTIGCPFDFVRTFWNKYFDERKTASDKLEWWNVYSPVDLLGSNFANSDGMMPQPERGINSSARGAADSGSTAKPALPKENLFYDPMGRREFKMIDAVSMAGFMAHTQYWVAGQSDAESCFQCFVPKLYLKS